MPSNLDLVEALIRDLGAEHTLAEELHHAREHSIELAPEWLHYFLRRSASRIGSGDILPTIVPILCGHMEPFIRGERTPDAEPAFERCLESLSLIKQNRRILMVIACDLANVGPAFGDPVPWDLTGRAQVRAADQESLEAVCRGDAGGFFQGLKKEDDRRRVCGLLPIYLALCLLGPKVSGEVAGYAQCSADPEGGSLVSIAGVVWSMENCKLVS